MYDNLDEQIRINIVFVLVSSLYTGGMKERPRLHAGVLLIVVTKSKASHGMCYAWGEGIWGGGGGMESFSVSFYIT